MPVYNGAKHLSKALDSILAQSHTDFDLYLFDDASTDESLAIINEYAQRDARIKGILLVDHLAGIPMTRYCWDYLSEHGMHDYSIHIGHHDIWTTNFLEILVARLH